MSRTLFRDLKPGARFRWESWSEGVVFFVKDEDGGFYAITDEDDQESIHFPRSIAEERDHWLTIPVAVKREELDEVDFDE